MKLIAPILLLSLIGCSTTRLTENTQTYLETKMVSVRLPVPPIYDTLYARPHVTYAVDPQTEAVSRDTFIVAEKVIEGKVKRKVVYHPRTQTVTLEAAQDTAVTQIVDTTLHVLQKTKVTQSSPFDTLWLAVLGIILILAIIALISKPRFP